MYPVELRSDADPLFEVLPWIILDIQDLNPYVSIERRQSITNLLRPLIYSPADLQKLQTIVGK